MKKLVLLLFVFSTLGSLTLSAQTKPADSTKSSRKSRAKKTATAAATTTAPATATTPPPKVATPPAPAPAVKTTPAPATAKTTATKPVVNPPNKSADKAVGTDAKGRTIYEGPRGGRYVLTASGNKEYLKKTN